MNLLIKVSAFLICLTLPGLAQIDNIQFKTMVTLDGKSWDLHEVLESGKHVYLQMFFNG